MSLVDDVLTQATVTALEDVELLAVPRGDLDALLASDPALSAFTAALRNRGLAFIDDGQAARRGGGGLPRASADRIVDDQLSEGAIDQQLLALEAGALQHGQALGSGFAYPVTLAQVARWAQSVEQRGYQLAPASALTVRR